MVRRGPEQPDLYTRLLGVPAGPRPPDHYLLLGLPRFAVDLQQVEKAVTRRMEQLDQWALHPDPAIRRAVQDLMTQVAQARVCLVDPHTKATYDVELARRADAATVDIPAGP